MTFTLVWHGRKTCESETDFYHSDDCGSLAYANNEVLCDLLVLGRVRLVDLQQTVQHPLVLLLLRENIRQTNNLKQENPHIKVETITPYLL